MTRRLIRLLVAACLLAAIAAPHPAFAATKKKEPRVRVYDKVVSVDATAKEIVIHDHIAKDDVTWKVNQFTKITVNNERAKLEDVKKGMKVNVGGSPSLKTATSIDAEEYPEEETKKK